MKGNNESVRRRFPVIVLLLALYGSAEAGLPRRNSEQLTRWLQLLKNSILYKAFGKRLNYSILMDDRATIKDRMTILDLKAEKFVKQRLI